MAPPAVEESLPRRPIDRLVRPLRIFGRHPIAGAALLLVATAAAIVWANTDAVELYHHLLEESVRIGVGELVFDRSVHHFINDGLMGFFFFLVGLEIKRELIAGELSTPRKALLPAVAALGGMLVPAGLYWLVAHESEAAAGWGIPMATDIAFALGVLALLGDRVPTGLKVFLTALAIVDDIGAVIVIAVFYTHDISLEYLGLGLGLFLVAVLLNLLRVRSSLAYLLVGVAAWLMFLQSGVHATIAALLMAFTIPARTRIDQKSLIERLSPLLERLRSQGATTHNRLNDPKPQGIIDEMNRTIDAAGAPLQQIEHTISPMVTFVILPIFALANAGVSFVDLDPAQALAGAETQGILLGLLLGKPIGIVLFTWVAIRTGIADMPKGASMLAIVGVGVLGGIGFTMALFIANVAFGPGTLLEGAKMGVLGASVVSALVGLSIVAFALRRRKGAE